MDDGIHFGELEEAEPQRQLRPDQNRHYAVIAYETPTNNDLPVYIDIDVVRDMEAHALSNTNSELGGVLLGGHYEDEDGNPFVVITDSLRAEHYEATKGSFKFTHETWSDITRKREEFPESTQMVGWYHTHPGWGVFLSGMDTFICDHFFNKPLDVALVIDPCQSERAFFQWTSQGGVRQTRATGGFFLTASRFRLPELEIFKAQLEGTFAMPSDPRYSGMPGGYPPPVVHITEPRQQAWLSVAVLGMLLMQFCLLALIAWRLLLPSGAALSAADIQAAELKREREFLDDIIGELKIAPDGVVQALDDERKNTEEMKTVNIGLKAHINEMAKTQSQLEKDKKNLTAKNIERQDSIDRLRESRAKSVAELKQLKKEVKELKGSEDDEEEATLWVWAKRWKWYISGGAMLLLIGAAAFYALYGPPEDIDKELPEEEEIDVPEEGQER